MEVTAAYILIGAALVFAVGWIWFLRASFRLGWSWGLGALLFPPVVFWYVRYRWKNFRGPVVHFTLAGLLALGALGLGYHERRNLFRERDTIVDGERHLTLTGWDKSDYSGLRHCKDVGQLYMANEDVTDETLAYLEGMDQLRVLDLDNTKVTDDGLAIIAKLPALYKLRLRHTAITDEGFRRHLMGLPNLTEITMPPYTKGPGGVKSKTLREWKKGGKDRRYN
jgi:hypothetical protein